MESDSSYASLDSSSRSSCLFSIPKDSAIASVFTLCSSIIGAGILTYPYIISQCGLVIGILVLIFVGFFLTVYYSLLVYACDAVKVYDYVQLIKVVFGEILIVDFFYGILLSLGVVHHEENLAISAGLKLVFLMLVWFPLCLPRELTALRYFSMMSLLGMCYILIVLALQAPYYIDPESYSTIKYADFSQFFTAFGVAFWAYDGGQNIPIIYNELADKSRNKMLGVIIKSMCILTIIYCSLGLLGYLSTQPNTPILIVFRAPISGESSDWAMIIGRIVVCVYLNMAIPMNLYPTRLTLEEMIWGQDMKRNTKIHIGTTLAILSSSTLLAIFGPNIMVFIEMLGSLSAVPLCVILPGCLYVRLSKNVAGRMYVGAGMGIGIALGAGCILNSLWSIV